MLRWRAVEEYPASDYQFTENWFMGVKPIWDDLFGKISPRRILEVGSFEGASICYVIDKLGRSGPLEIHCIDTWEGGVEHQTQGYDMSAVETRFDHNVAKAISRCPNPVDFKKHKGSSEIHLSRLIATGRRSSFDLVYIDGSHQAPDVLVDAVLGFSLLRPGGVMVFDDYTWFEQLPQGKDPLRCPKLAIDAFVNVNFRKIEIINSFLYQLYLIKTQD